MKMLELALLAGVAWLFLGKSSAGSESPAVSSVLGNTVMTAPAFGQPRYVTVGETTYPVLGYTYDVSNREGTVPSLGFTGWVAGKPPWLP